MRVNARVTGVPLLVTRPTPASRQRPVFGPATAWVQPVARAARAATGVAAALVALGGEATAQEPKAAQEPQVETVPVLEPPTEDRIIPVFPGSRAIRLRLESDIVPKSSIEDGNDVATYGANARLRVALPVSERVGVQVVARYGASVYEFDGATDPFGTGPRRGNPYDEFHDISLGLQGSVAVADSLLFEGEQWSLLAEARGLTRFESGAFQGGFGGGGAVAVGYRFPNRVDLAIGVEMGVGSGDRSFKVRPVGEIRVRLTDDLVVATRGRGVQAEYRLSRKLRLFAAWFQTGQGWRLENRRGVPGRLRLEDKQSRAVAGFEWRLHSQLRVRLETGAVLTRKLKVKSRDGTLSDVDGDPTGFVRFSLELRP